MGADRRTFLKTATLGAAGVALGNSLTMGQGKRAVDKLYDGAIVIDSLSVGRQWREVAYTAVKESGYTGIQTSLHNRTWDGALKDIAEWNDRISENPDLFLKATTATHFRQGKKENKLAVMYGHQNTTMIENKIGRLDILHDLGTRCIQLTYNSRNLVGDGCTERTNAGLSDFGMDVVERMNKLGIIVDLSHCGKQTSYDGIQFSDPPACFTHTMCEAIYRDHPRAKTDKQIRTMADKGGVIGVAALGYFVGPDPGGKTTIETYLNHVDHAVKVGGIDHVALCTDFPIQGIKVWATKDTWYEPRLKSFKPSYNVKWPPWIPDLDKPGRFRSVAHGLNKRGYSDDKIEKILGLNWLRYFDTVLSG
ncbi:MAG: membrane dipeptidase [Dehalococcoidia bacterium]|nr:membrane dipeptidase [Dehalococcoidia bacterium]